MVSPGTGAGSTNICGTPVLFETFQIRTGKIYSHRFAIVNQNKDLIWKISGHYWAAATAFAFSHLSPRAILNRGMRRSNGIALP